MDRWDYFWAGVGSTILVGEWVTRKGPGSLSRTMRKWWRVHTRPGKIAFAGSWGAFAGWVIYHIIFDQPKENAT